MKSIQTILFGVFLSGWLEVHVNAGSSMSIGDFFTSQYQEICIRLQTWIDASPDDLLPFLFSRSAVKDLNYVSGEFVEYFVKTETELYKLHYTSATIVALQKTIDVEFEGIAKRTKSKKSAEILNQIKQVDPLGLDAFLEKVKKRTDGEYDLDEALMLYLGIMADRLLLFNCKETPTLVKDPAFNAGAKLNNIPEDIRKEIATEDRVISEATINHFLDIAARQFKVKIYKTKENQPHNAKGSDGVKILFGGRVGSNDDPNWICVRYNGNTKKLHVYDNVFSGSNMKGHITEIQEDILNNQFPDKAGPIVYEKSTTPQAKPAASGIYAMIYAATLLQGDDPAKITFKLNFGYGDKSLYMRLHLLKIFANRRLSAME